MILRAFLTEIESLIELKENWRPGLRENTINKIIETKIKNICEAFFSVPMFASPDTQWFSSTHDLERAVVVRRKLMVSNVATGSRQKWDSLVFGIMFRYKYAIHGDGTVDAKNLECLLVVKEELDRAPTLATGIDAIIHREERKLIASASKPLELTSSNVESLVAAIEGPPTGIQELKVVSLMTSPTTSTTFLIRSR